MPSATSLIGQRGHIRAHILPALGDLPLDRVNNEAVAEFFAKLLKEGYQRKGRPATSEKPDAVRKRRSRAKRAKARRAGLQEKSVKNIRATLSTILDRAKVWGYIDAIPDLPEVVAPAATFDWYKPEDVAQLLRAATDPWERALLMFALHTGTRMGEQRALRWADVDFGRRLISVYWNAPGALSSVKAPKSGKPRWVDMSPELAEALQAIKHAGELVFCRADGSMLQPGDFHEVMWRAQKAAGLRRIRWHELRHSYASILASGGTPLALIRGLLGHSTVAMTEKYAHLARPEPTYLGLLSAVAPGQPGAKTTGDNVQ